MKIINKFNPWALFAAAISIVIYIKTLCPTVFFGDSGELSAVAYTLSIAHPPGYPLFTLVGWLFSHFPLAGISARMNLMAALFSCVSVYFVYLILDDILIDVFNNADNRSVKTFSFLGALIWGFSNTLWDNSVGAEVYSLGMALAACFIYLYQKQIQSPSPKRLIFAFYILGLAAANHLSGIALAPIAIMFIPWQKFGLKRFFWACGAFLIALTLYLYIPIRSANYPLIDWSHPADWHSFFEHISSARYQRYLTHFSLTNLAINLKRFIHILPAEFPLAPVGLIGLIVLGWRKPRFGVPILLMVAINIGFATLYEIPDIEPHFLITIFASVIGLATLIKFGFDWIGKTIKKESIASYTGLVAIILILAIEFVDNYSLNNESDNRLAETHGRNILEPLPKDALLISVGWTAGSPSIYLHYVEHVRPDIKLYDPISMASTLAKAINKQDSLHYISERDMALYALNNYQGLAFLGKEHFWGGDNPFKYAQLPLQGYGLVYSYGKKQSADLSIWPNIKPLPVYQDNKNLGIMERITIASQYLAWGEDLQSAGKTQEARDKYLTVDKLAENTTEPSFLNALGIFFRRQGVSDLAELQYNRSLASPFITNSVRADVMVNMGNLYRDKKDYATACSKYLAALSIKPNLEAAKYNLAVTGAYLSLQEKDYQAAIDNFRVAVTLDPSDPMLFYNLGLIYDTYLKDNTMALTYYKEFLRRAGDNSLLATSLRNRIAVLGG